MKISPRLALGFTAAVLLTLLLPFGASAGPPSSGQVSMFTEKVDGYVRAWPGDCPDDVPAEPLVCTEWDLTVFRVGTDETKGGVAPPRATWVLIALHHTLTFPGDYAEPIESDAAQGFRDPVDVTFDREHLSYATVRADDLRLDDGTVVDLRATFTGFGDRQHYGNDGPANGPDVPRQDHQRCTTVVNQSHQKYRLATAVAVVDGVESRYDGRFGFIAFNHFKSIEVHPASCT